LKKRYLIKAISAVLFLLVLFFILKYLYKNLFALKDFSFNINIFHFIISLTTIWFWLFISSFIFHLIIKKIVPEAKLKESLAVWSASYLGTYIPGKVGVLAFRIMHYKQMNVSPVKTGYGFFVETVLSVLSSCFLVLLSMFFTNFSFVREYLPLLVFLFILLFLSVHPKLIGIYAKIYFKYIRKETQNHVSPYTYFFFVEVVMLHLIKWVCIGLGIFILINSVTELEWRYLPFITGLYAAAAILGMLAFFAPSGLGVVEGVMIIGLKTIISNSLAGAISILIRIWKMVGEISFILLVRLFLRRILNVSDLKA